MTSSTDCKATRPFVYLKFACSLDGFLDNNSNQRHIFSNELDLRAVDELRANSSAILIGAETLRKDNPSLKLKFLKEKDPLRVVITNSGKLDFSFNFFKDDGVEKIVYTKQKLQAVASKVKGLTIVENSKMDLKFILADLHARGIESLLLEGGASLIAQFLEQDLVDKIRIAYGNEILGERGKAKLSENINSVIEGKFEIKKVSRLQNVNVIELSRV
ncbi:MAG: RibD family protein [Proteobacteria bacterium]|nr:RibD family protein [Pseudomonadota bacterium]